MKIAVFALIAGALALGGCTRGVDLAKIPGYGQGSGKRIDGSRLGGYANPSEVAATDIAFARAARDDGQWTAFRNYAADGAQIHGRSGAIDAGPWLAAQDDPAAPVQWTPTAVWSSCDGSTAVTQGKFADPEGQWGYYVTVWERQRDGRYRWVYDMGAPDDELTAAENAQRDNTPTGENTIVIRAIEAIEGRVADCSPDSVSAGGFIGEGMVAEGDGHSRDYGLNWNWAHFEDGSRSFFLSMLRDGEWEEMLSFEIGPNGKHIPDQ